MQFYIIRAGPKASAKALPLYALRVNIREGWQILSDIGHRFGSSWDHQCKPYNPVHPWTRQFSHIAGLSKFLNHYRACLAEYEERTGKTMCWHEWFEGVGADAFDNLPFNQEEETVHYLRTVKADKMSDAEKERL